MIVLALNTRIKRNLKILILILKQKLEQNRTSDPIWTWFV